jgi:hypothetical protein
LPNNYQPCRHYRRILSVGDNIQTTLPTDIIRRYFTESCHTITTDAIITDGLSVGNYRWKFRRIDFVSNVPARNFFSLARVSICKTVGGLFFLFATELAMEREITDDYYTDGRVPSVRPSVIISPTEFIPVTNGMSPSVKLINGVVYTYMCVCVCVLFSFLLK